MKAKKVLNKKKKHKNQPKIKNLHRKQQLKNYQKLEINLLLKNKVLFEQVEKRLI